MQIDFHHGTIYILARLAGFNKSEANILAYCSQYVDDATSYGTICFDNKALYQRISSAHKILDLRNTKAIENHLVWIPFHFLPGNGGAKMGRNPRGIKESFIYKIICTPDSPIAKQMVNDTIRDNKQIYSLHRFGVAMHVYADTWAHQRFAGVLHEINEVDNVKETGDSKVFKEGLEKFLIKFIGDAAPPLGHGRANVLPDMPFLKWEYKNGKGLKISRDNSKIFCDAANAVFKAMKQYKAGTTSPVAANIPANDMKEIRNLFITLRHKDGEKRHKKWIKAIKEGVFSFGSETVKYKARGRKSWKHKALGSSHDLMVHTYTKTFLRSNWKLFHDAIQAHRFYVNHDLLPKFGICAA